MKNVNYLNCIPIDKKMPLLVFVGKIAERLSHSSYIKIVNVNVIPAANCRNQLTSRFMFYVRKGVRARPKLDMFIHKHQT